MGLPLVIDIAIGLAFIYLILSLLASEVQEIITTIMQWRAKHLKESIETLISGTTNPNDPSLSPEQRQLLIEAREQGQKLVGTLYEHPLVNSLNYEKTGKIAKFLRRITSLFLNASKNGGPSAIPANTFASSILQTLKVETIVREVNGAKIDAFRQRIDEVVDQAYEHIATETSIDARSKTSLSPVKMDKVLGVIVAESTQNQLTIKESFNKMYGQLNRYMEEAKVKLPEETQQQRDLKHKFLAELETIREEIYLDEKQAVWLENTPTTISQVLRAYQELKQAKKDPDSAIAQKLAAAEQGAKSLHGQIETIIEKSGNKDAEKMWNLVQTVPDNLMDSMAAIAEQTQANIEDVEADLQQFKQGVATWFDNGMTRANGVYKRNAKGFAFLLGAIIAVAANVDTFYVVNQLSHDSVLRGVLASQGSNTVANIDVEQDGMPQSRAELESAGGFNIDDLDLPIGWNQDNCTQQALYRLGVKQAKESQYKFLDPATGEPRLKNLAENFTVRQRAWGWFKEAFGWFVSAIAISMGAPFWFELLSKVVDIKNTGSTAAPKSEDTKKSA